MVFSAREVEYINRLADPAFGFCAAFCCKEAVFKALGQPINFVECELLYIPDQVIQQPRLSFGTAIPEIADCSVRIFPNLPGELVAVAYLFGKC